MNWKLLKGVALLLLLSATSQQKLSAAPTQYAFRISFTSKLGSPPIGAASSYLSSRALNRRQRMGIAVDSVDRPISPVYLDSVLRLADGKLHVTSRWLNNCVILLEDSAKILLLQGKSWISDIALVGVFADGLHLAPTSPNMLPSSPNTADKSTGYSFVYGNTWNQTHLVNGDYLHDRGYTGRGMLIAILDAGFRGVDFHPVFDSMRLNGRVADVHNFYLANDSVYNYSQHGTAVLSTLAGYVAGTYVGTAPNAEYALYVTEVNNGEFPIELDQYVAALERADSIGADVLNASLGYNTFNAPFTNQNYTIQDLDGKTTIVAKGVNIATQRGMLVVTTAGNEGNSNWNFLLTPGDADSGLCTGAVIPSRQAAGLSSPGPNAALVVKPDVCLQGDPAAVAGDNNNYFNSSGTSFAAPQLAGWAACLMEANPTARPYQIKDAIRRSSDRFTNPSPKLGYGIPDFSKTLLSLSVAGQTSSQGNRQMLYAWPNPFTNILQIALPASMQNKMVDVILYDVNGKMVKKETLLNAGKSYVLALPAALPTGVYVLKATAGAEAAAYNVLKQ